MAPKKGNSKKSKAEQALANAAKKTKTNPPEATAATTATEATLLWQSDEATVHAITESRGGDLARVAGLTQRRFSFIPLSARSSEKQGGLLLEDRLLLEVQKRPPPLRVPQSVIHELVTLYGANYDPVLSFRLDEVSGSASAPDVLLNNLDMATSQDNHVRNAKPLLGWFKYTNELTAKVLCGVVKTVYTSWWMSSKDHDSVYLVIMSCIDRLNCIEAVRSPFQAFKHLFDEALASTFNASQKEGAKVFVWVKNNLGRLSLLMNRADLDAAVAAKGQWSDVADIVNRMYCSSKTGKKIFAFAAGAVQAEVLKKLIETGLQAVTRDNFVFATVQAEQQKVAQKALAMDQHKGRGKKRQIKVDIVTMKVDREICTATEEWDERLSANVKTASLGMTNGLPLLPHERLLVHVDAALTCSVPESVLQSHMSARELCLSMLENANITCFEDVQRVMAKAEEGCTHQEESFSQEIDYVVKGSCGTDIDASIHSNVLKLLPSPTQTKGFVEVLSAFDGFMKEDSFKYCTRAAQAAVTAVKTEVENVKAGMAPNLRLNNQSAFWKSLWLALQNFCVWKGKVGKDALTALFDEVKQVVGAKPPDELKQLNNYKWMMSPEQRLEFTDWCKDTIANAGVDSGSSSAVSSGTRNIMRYF